MKESLRHLFTHNLGLKLLSLVLATGIWFILKSDPIAEAAVEVPVVFRNIPDHLGMSYESIPKAQVLLRGPERAVRKLQASDVNAEIDVAGLQAGQRTFPSSAVRVHHPHDLELVNVGPSQFKITFIAVGKTAAQTGSNPAH